MKISQSLLEATEKSSKELITEMLGRKKPLQLSEEDFWGLFYSAAREANYTPMGWAVWIERCGCKLEGRICVLSFVQATIKAINLAPSQSRFEAALPDKAFQEAIDAGIKASGKPRKDFYQMCYESLLGQKSGPRLATFIKIYGIANFIGLIRAAKVRTRLYNESRANHKAIDSGTPKVH